MSEEYSERVLKHYKIQNDILFDLMMIAQRLCPGGEWVFQLFASPEMNESGKLKKSFLAAITNGDDNVTAICENPGAAVAKLISYMLEGSVFPLTGNGGRKFYPGDMDWIKRPEGK